jgi:glycosyltransferase involved in cell wall biosynthesis
VIPQRILHINTERGWRGGERQTFLLALELRRRGHHNWIVARPGEPLAMAAGKEGLPVIPVRPWGEADLWTAARLARFAQANEISLFHAHTGHAVGLGALAVWRSPIPFVATRRVDFPLGSGFFSQWKYRRLGGVAVLSTAIRRAVLEGGIPENKISIIPSGIDPAGYPRVEDREFLRLKYGFSKEDQILINVGALVPHKDQATFLRAAAQVALVFPQAKFLILGEGPLRKELESLVEKLGLTDRVFLLGHRPEVLEYVAMADLFVFSSVEEGLGSALLDAFVMGVPTVATAAGGIPDLYGGSSAPELSSPRDARALADNIRRVLSHPEERALRVGRGRERGRLFSVQAMGDAYEKFYDLHRHKFPSRRVDA